MTLNRFPLINSIAKEKEFVSIQIGDELYDKLKQKKVINQNYLYYKLTNNSKTNIDFRKVSDDILIIPFILNILPLTWLLNIDVEIDLCESSFLESLYKLRNSYRSIWKELSFLGEISSKNTYSITTPSGQNGICLYSGGVDSLDTFITNQQHINYLLTIYGGDIKNNDKSGIEQSILNSVSLAKKFGKQSLFINSNFMEMLNYNGLNKLLPFNCDWWTNIQHGPVLAGFMLIFSKALNLSECFIASTDHASQLTRIASRPDLEANLRLGKIVVHHDGTSKTRQEKLSHIINNINDVSIHVCYSSSSYQNCGLCPKCLLTAAGTLALGHKHILDLNFPTITPEKMLHSLKSFFSDKSSIDWGDYIFWEDIKNSLNNDSFYKTQKLEGWLDVIMYLRTIDLYTIYCRKRDSRKTLVVQRRKFRFITPASF